MTLFFADLVREFSSSAGAGDFVLGGALPGHRRFAGVVPAGARFHYAIAGVTRPDEWEAGEGEIGSGGALVRMPAASSAGGALVDFSAGLKTVALTVGASWYAAQEARTGIDEVSGLQAALDAKADAAHDHGGAYAPAGHDHDGAYAPAVHGHDDVYAAADHDHGGAYAAAGHDHDGAYAPAGHNHDGAYAPAGHGHDGVYAAAGHGHSFASLTNKPTTLAGYGIGDAAPAGHHHDQAYQPLDADLSAIAALPSAADRLAYATGPGAWALTALSGFGRALIDDADAAGARATLGLGSLATQGADAVAITGGTVSGLASLSVTGPIGSSETIGTNAPSPKGNAKIEVPGDTGTPGYVGFYINGGTRVGFVGYRSGNRLMLTTEAGLTGWAANGDLSLGGPLSIGGLQVVGSRRGGWSAPTGTAARVGFDSASVTTAELAQRVKALIDDLMTHGLIGS